MVLPTDYTTFKDNCGFYYITQLRLYDYVVHYKYWICIDTEDGV